MSQAADTVRSLVSEGAELKKKIADSKRRLDEITAQLVDMGAGDYGGEHGETAKVIQPGPQLKPSSEDIEAAKDLAGDHFTKLFDRTIAYAPKKGFREIAEALLTPGLCKKLIALCEKASSAYVKWS